MTRTARVAIDVIIAAAVVVAMRMPLTNGPLVVGHASEHLEMTSSGPAAQPPSTPDFRFRSGIDLVTITATVVDEAGRFVSGLTRDDFIVYEDNAARPITHFMAERVPVSLGIALDTSQSMSGEKMQFAQDALRRFTGDLLDRADEICIYRFDDSPALLQGWTRDRAQLSRALTRITPHGGTALFDAVAEAVPTVGLGQYRKRALVLISDGRDTASATGARQARDVILDSDVVVYAIGVDGDALGGPRSQAPVRRPPLSPPGQPGGRTPLEPPRWPIPTPGSGTDNRAGASEKANGATLRELTDSSGGRTEIIRSARDLGPATAGIADELSRQYLLGYASAAGRDGRWHAIRVEPRNPAYRIRARRGYVAS